VGFGEEALAPGVAELAGFAVEAHDGGTFALEDEDVVLGIDGDAGDLAELETGGDLGPIGDYAVTVFGVGDGGIGECAGGEEQRRGADQKRVTNRRGFHCVEISEFGGACRIRLLKLTRRAWRVREAGCRSRGCRMR